MRGVRSQKRWEWRSSSVATLRTCPLSVDIVYSVKSRAEARTACSLLKELDGCGLRFRRRLRPPLPVRHGHAPAPPSALPGWHGSFSFLSLCHRTSSSLTTSSRATRVQSRSLPERPRTSARRCSRWCNSRSGWATGWSRASSRRPWRASLGTSSVPLLHPLPWPASRFDPQARPPTRNPS